MNISIRSKKYLNCFCNFVFTVFACLCLILPINFSCAESTQDAQYEKSLLFGFMYTGNIFSHYRTDIQTIKIDGVHYTNKIPLSRNLYSTHDKKIFEMPIIMQNNAPYYSIRTIIGSTSINDTPEGMLINSNDGLNMENNRQLSLMGVIVGKNAQITVKGNSKLKVLNNRGFQYISDIEKLTLGPSIVVLPNGDLTLTLQEYGIIAPEFNSNSSIRVLSETTVPFFLKSLIPTVSSSSATANLRIIIGGDKGQPSTTAGFLQYSKVLLEDNNHTGEVIINHNNRNIESSYPIHTSFIGNVNFNFLSGMTRIFAQSNSTGNITIENGATVILYNNQTFGSYVKLVKHDGDLIINSGVQTFANISGSGSIKMSMNNNNESLIKIKINTNTVFNGQFITDNQKNLDLAYDKYNIVLENSELSPNSIFALTGDHSQFIGTMIVNGVLELRKNSIWGGNIEAIGRPEANGLLYAAGQVNGTVLIGPNGFLSVGESMEAQGRLVIREHLIFYEGWSVKLNIGESSSDIIEVGSRLIFNGKGNIIINIDNPGPATFSKVFDLFVVGGEISGLENITMTLSNQINTPVFLVKYRKKDKNAIRIQWNNVENIIEQPDNAVNIEAYKWKPLESCDSDICATWSADSPMWADDSGISGKNSESKPLVFSDNAEGKITKITNTVKVAGLIFESNHHLKEGVIAISKQDAEFVVSPRKIVNINSIISGDYNFRKKGSGLLTLSGFSDNYNKTISIDEGSVYISGSIGGTVEVRSGATLLGNGGVFNRLLLHQDSSIEFNLHQTQTMDGVNTTSLSVSNNVNYIIDIPYGSLRNSRQPIRLFSYQEASGTTVNNIQQSIALSIMNAEHINEGLSLYIDSPSAMKKGSIGIRFANHYDQIWSANSEYRNQIGRIAHYFWVGANKLGGTGVWSANSDVWTDATKTKFGPNAPDRNLIFTAYAESDNDITIEGRVLIYGLEFHSSKKIKGDELYMYKTNKNEDNTYIYKYARQNNIDQSNSINNYYTSVIIQQDNENNPYQVYIYSEITGPGSLRKLGKGILHLMRSNTYNGDSYVAQGDIVAHADNVLSDNAILSINKNGSFYLHSSNDPNGYSQNLIKISGDGNIYFGANARLNIKLGTDSIFSGNFLSNSTQDSNYSINISGNHKLTINPSDIGRNNSFNGQINIDSGALLELNGAIGSSDAYLGRINVSGALSGVGFAQNVRIEPNGLFAPGIVDHNHDIISPIGTFEVDKIEFDCNSLFDYQIGKDGLSDKLVVNTLASVRSGAELRIRVVDGASYNDLKDKSYTVIESLSRPIEHNHESVFLINSDRIRHIIYPQNGSKSLSARLTTAIDNNKYVLILSFNEFSPEAMQASSDYSNNHDLHVITKTGSMRNINNQNNHVMQAMRQFDDHNRQIITNAIVHNDRLESNLNSNLLNNISESNHIAFHQNTNIITAIDNINSMRYISSLSRLNSRRTFTAQKTSSSKSNNQIIGYAPKIAFDILHTASKNESTADKSNASIWMHQSRTLSSGLFVNSSLDYIFGIEGYLYDQSIRLGITGGYSLSKIASSESSKLHSESKTYSGGIYGAITSQYCNSACVLGFGASFGYSNVFARQSYKDHNSLASKYGLSLSQLYGDFGYAANFYGIILEPFVQIAHLNGWWPELNTFNDRQYNNSDSPSKLSNLNLLYSTTGINVELPLGRVRAYRGKIASLQAIGTFAWRRILNLGPYAINDEKIDLSDIRNFDQVLTLKANDLIIAMDFAMNIDNYSMHLYYSFQGNTHHYSHKFGINLRVNVSFMK